MQSYSSGGAITNLFSAMTSSAASAGAASAAAAGWRDEAAPEGQAWPSGPLRWCEPASGELEVRVPVPAGTRKKELNVVMTAGAIGVAFKGAAPAASNAGAAAPAAAPPAALSLTLFAEVDASESQWQVEDGAVVFSLVKRRDKSVAWPRLARTAEEKV